MFPTGNHSPYGDIVIIQHIAMLKNIVQFSMGLKNCYDQVFTLSKLFIKKLSMDSHWLKDILSPCVIDCKDP